MPLPSGLPAAPPIIAIRDRLLGFLSSDDDLAACIEAPIEKYDMGGASRSGKTGTKPTLCLVYSEEDLTRATLGGRGAGTHEPSAGFWLLAYMKSAATATGTQESDDLIAYVLWYAKLALLKNYRDENAPQLWNNIVFYQPASAWEAPQNIRRGRIGLTVKQNRVRHP